MRGGILGLFIALTLVASVSVGLSLAPSQNAELCIDFCISISACLAVVVCLLKNKYSVCVGVISLVFAGVAWGGHAATRESIANIRGSVGLDSVLVQFQAELIDAFEKPDAPDEDLLDQFQNAVEPPRYRALSKLHYVVSEGVQTPCDGTVTLFIDGNGSEFLIGDIVQGVGWLRGVGAPTNPGEIDFRIRSFRNNHGGNLSVAGNPKKISSGSSQNLFFQSFRSQICAWVDHNLIASIAPVAPPEIQTLVVAMTTGRQLSGYKFLRQQFSASGLSHFLAISGFNLAVLFGAVWIGMEFFHFSWIIRGWFLTLTACIFLFVVDVETSVLRAGIAGILVGISVACDRGWRADGLLAVAAIFTLICDPWAAWNPGFQLSYGAVLALRYGSEPILKICMSPCAFFPRLAACMQTAHVKQCVTAFSASIAAWLMSTPITESHFGSISIWAAIASTILAPLAALITVLASLACLVGSVPVVGIVLGYPLTISSTLFLWIAESVGQLPAANIRGQAVPWWMAVAQLLALFGCWIAPRAQLRRYLFVLFAILFFSGFFISGLVDKVSPTDWRLRMTSISVGDGSAHVIETPHSCVLFDAGTISRRAGGSKLVVPALKAIGCSKFNAVFISHPHLDHFSALPEIAAEFEIDKVFATEAFLKYKSTQYAPGVLIDDLEKRGIQITPCTAGKTFVFDGFMWTALHPKLGYQSRIVNDGSLVLRIEPEKKSLDTPVSTPCVNAWLTLCGDAQTEAIANVLASPSFGPSLVMELPHHGAWSDGVGDLVLKINSDILIQSTGFQRFRFDRIRSVVENKIRGVTCRDGALRVTWFEKKDQNKIIIQILLERWVGDGWVVVTSHECRKQ